MEAVPESAPGSPGEEPRGCRPFGNAQMHIKVYLRSPPEVLAPDLPPAVQEALPDLQLPEGSTLEALLRILGVGKARPFVLVNQVVRKGNVALRDGDRVDLVLPIAGG